MKEISKNKRGISLIVLVITIIVMIILAAAIILSLNSSDIIGKANEAKTSSDTANKKAAASVLLAEYELALVNGETTKTPSQYVKEGLEAQGIDASDIAITEDREILVGLSKAAVAFVEAGVQIGDTVTGYTLSQDASAKSYTTSGEENRYDASSGVEINPVSATLEREEGITWKYIGINEKGEALIAGDVTNNTPKLKMTGRGGYINGTSELDTACKIMYSSDMGNARNMKIEDVIMVLEYTGELGAYKDKNGNYVPTPQPLTIGEVEEKLGITISSSIRPDGSALAKEDKLDNYEIKSSSYYIPGEVDTNEYNVERESLIFPSGSITYWLSSKSSWFDGAGGIIFSIRCVDIRSVHGGDFFLASTGGSGFDANTTHNKSIRPVVELSDTVTVESYNLSTGIVTIK